METAGVIRFGVSEFHGCRILALGVSGFRCTAFWSLGVRVLGGSRVEVLRA